MGKGSFGAAALVVLTLGIGLVCTAYITNHQRNQSKVKTEEVEALSMDYLTAVKPMDNGCCAKFGEIPWLETNDSYSAKQLLGTCDRSIPVTHDCYYKSCCNSKTHQSCNACCDMRGELNLPGAVADCKGRCQKCFTCNFPTPADGIVPVPPVFFGRDQCRPGGCTKIRKCIPSPDNSYCRCVNREAFEKMRSQLNIKWEP